MPRRIIRMLITPFTFWISFSVALADNWDPLDDTGLGATLLVVTNIVQSHGPHTTTNAVDDADWFKCYLEAGNRYRFETVGASDTHGNLYSDNQGLNQVVYEDYRSGDAGEGSNFLILYTPAASQFYYLKVTEDQSGGSTAYSLQYVHEPSLDSWDPLDDSSATATSLTIDNIVREHGEHTLGPADHYDWFTFNLVEGVEYTFESTGPWDTVGILYDSTLSELISDDASGEGLNFQLVFTATSSGTHYLSVSDWEPGLDIAYSLQYYTSSNPDSDGDGMADTWEIYYFGSTNAQPTAHGDADSQNNLQEYIAGTDPTNSASFFAVTNWSGGSFVIEWPSVSGREYRVLWAETLTNSFEYIGPVIDYPQNSYTDTLHSAEDSGFYKVEVQLK